MKSLQFSYNPPKFVKIIGRAADRQWASNTVVNGVLVKENFKYQLIDAQLSIRDIDTFTKLKLCRILYRQHFKSRLDLAGIFTICSLSGKKVELVRIMMNCEIRMLTRQQW